MDVRFSDNGRPRVSLYGQTFKGLDTIETVTAFNQKDFSRSRSNDKLICKKQ
jgi:hypothetical protein